MERILSLNQNYQKQNPTDDDYYYPVSDIMLFKNYSAYINGELSQNNNSSNNNSSGNNNSGK